jgi:hypothetical protein
VKFSTVVGLVIFWRWGTLNATLCRSCGEAAYNDSQGSTLLKGWWGLIAPFGNLIAFFLNMSRIGKVRALSKPVGRYPGAHTLLTHPLPQSTPWYKRPASMVASVIALSIVGFIIAALLQPVVSTSTSSSSNATEFVDVPPVGSCWSVEDDGGPASYEEVPCNSPRATLVISKSVLNSSECGFDFFPENDGSFSCLDRLPTDSIEQPSNETTAEPAEPVTATGISGIPFSDLTTCIKGVNVENTCAPGATWTYSYCYDIDPADPTVSLLRSSGGKWDPVDQLVARSSPSVCSEPGFPYLVVFEVTQKKLGPVKYRLVAGTFNDDFTATVTGDPGPAKRLVVGEIATINDDVFIGIYPTAITLRLISFKSR